MFANFSLPDVVAVSRRTVFSALAVGIVALVACTVLGAALVGVGGCLGIGLGIANFRMIQRSVAKVGRREDPNRRRPLALNTLSRLALISVVVLGLLFLSFELGAGVLGGLAVFQAILLLNVLRSMLVMGAGGGVPGGAGEEGDGGGAGQPGAAGNAGDVLPGGAGGDALTGGPTTGPLEPVEVPDDRRGG